MTIHEMVQEIRTYECQQDRGYAFISYSHQDRERVYPLVLTWMRAGYNLYIDLDFARHGSDHNWIQLMTKALNNIQCRLAICFGSTHYTYSYASLLELLTMRGKSVTAHHANRPLPIDYYALEKVSLDSHELCLQLQPKYKTYFENLQADMGQHFLEQKNQKELNALQKGLTDWFASGKALLNDATADEWMHYLDEAYETGYLNFFPMISVLTKNWLVGQELLGNYYTPNMDVEVQYERFAKQNVEKCRNAVIPPVEQDLSHCSAESLVTLAENGDPEAQKRLGDCYRFGLDTERSYPQAAKWYEKAASQGHRDAQCILGCFHELGMGVEKDFLKAITWYRKAAEQGDTEAQKQLNILISTQTAVSL